MPALPEELFLDSLHELIKVDRDWIPSDAGGQPLPAAVHVRQRGVPRRAAGHRVPLLGDRLAGRPVLRARRAAGHRLGVRRSTPARRRAAPARPSAAATTRPAWPPRPRRSSTAATRCLPRRGRAPLRRRARRHERLLRLRRRQHRHAAAHRHDPARHHPRLGHHPGPRRRRTRCARSRTASSSGRPTPRAAGSARRSPAAPPR